MTTQILFNGLPAFAILSALPVTGLLFNYVPLVMPGLRYLADCGFLGGFQEIDGIIQRSHPIFAVVWF